MRRLLPLVILALVGAGLWEWWLSPSVKEQARSTGAGDPGLVERDGGREALPGGATDGLDLERLTLLTAPVRRYMEPLEAPAQDAELDEIIAASSLEALDPWLSRAAQELAVQGALIGEHPPESILSFVLRSSGAPELSVAQLVLEGDSRDDSLRATALARAFEERPTGRGQLVAGLGEAVSDELVERRRVVVLTARRVARLDPVARAVETSQTLRVTGESLIPLEELHASVLYANGRIEEAEAELSADGRFAVSVATGPQTGALSVSLGASDEGGPFKFMQLEFQVGAPLPRSMPLDFGVEEVFDNEEDAARYALELLNVDREQHGLDRLEWDAELAAIARAHAQDMLDHDFFAHKSPRTGLASDRLAAAGYRANRSAENLALNDTIGESQRSLMASVGHRRNILDPEMDHVGIGVVREEGAERPQWRLVQVFARKVVAIDERDATRWALAHLTRAEAELGESLEESPELNRLADRWLEGIDLSEEELGDALEDLPSAVAHDAITEGWRGAVVRVQVVGELDDLEFDLTPAEFEMSHHGLALRQDPADRRGRILVLVVQAGPP